MSDFFINLALTVAVGVIIGWERQHSAKVLGVRTTLLVLLGAFMFTYISVRVPGSDPSRVIAQVVTGVGFIGGGIIFREGVRNIHNLTTAVLIWTMSAVGCMLCLSMRIESLTVSALIYVILRLGKLRHHADSSADAQ